MNNSRAPVNLQSCNDELQPRQRFVSLSDHIMMEDIEPIHEKKEVRTNSTNCSADGKESFPVKLMHILQLIDTTEPELAHIISWQPNGTTFRIHDKKLFEKLVKQRAFFNQKSYSSFRRQLNLWGFRKIGKRCAADCGVYGHPLFLKENPSLCHTIARSGSSKTTKQVTPTTTKTSTSCSVSATSSSYEDTASITDSSRSFIGTDDSMQSKVYEFYGTVRKPTFPTFPSIDEEIAKQHQPMPTFDMDKDHDTFMSDLDCFDIGDCFNFDDDNEPLSFFVNA